jgi:hypothetical protein
MEPENESCNNNDNKICKIYNSNIFTIKIIKKGGKDAQRAAESGQ